MLTGADAAKLSQVERLTLASLPSFDGAGSGLENLPQLKNLTVTVNGAPEASFALPADIAGNLSAVKIRVGAQVESLSVDAPDFEGSLAIGSASEGGRVARPDVWRRPVCHERVGGGLPGARLA